MKTWNNDGGNGFVATSSPCCGNGAMGTSPPEGLWVDVFVFKAGVFFSFFYIFVF